MGTAPSRRSAHPGGGSYNRHSSRQVIHHHNDNALGRHEWIEIEGWYLEACGAVDVFHKNEIELCQGNDHSKGRHQTPLGKTDKSNDAIQAFNAQWKRFNPWYALVSHDCQKYARQLAVFLLGPTHISLNDIPLREGWMIPGGRCKANVVTLALGQRHPLKHEGANFGNIEIVNNGPKAILVKSFDHGDPCQLIDNEKNGIRPGCKAWVGAQTNLAASARRGPFCFYIHIHTQGQCKKEYMVLSERVYDWNGHALAQQDWEKGTAAERPDLADVGHDIFRAAVQRQ